MSTEYHLFFDESGNTGTDLLNNHQPVFSLASTNISAQVAAGLVRPLLRQSQVEVKYRKLRGTKRGQEQILQLLRSPDLHAENSKVYVADKRYYLVSHLVDKLIEPPLHEGGVNLYENDGHVGLTNVWYLTGHTIFPGGHWQKVLLAFLNSVRIRDAESFRRFDAALLDAFKHAAGDSQDFAAGLFLCRGRLAEFIGVYRGNEVFDPAADCFIALTHQWMAGNRHSFHVSHDQSKPLRRSAPLLRALMTPVATRTIGFRGRQVELPLRVSQLEFVDSKSSPSIQLADFLAGAGSDLALGFLGRGHDKEFHAALQDTKLLELVSSGLMPSTTIAAEFVPRPGESSLVDGATTFLREVGYC